MGVCVIVQYYAALREQRGLSNERIETDCRNLNDLYKELKIKYGFKLDTDVLKVAVNNEFVDWSRDINENEHIIFIPPVSGG